MPPPNVTQRVQTPAMDRSRGESRVRDVQPQAEVSAGITRNVASTHSADLFVRSASSTGPQILGFSTPMQNSVGRVTFPWENPGDVIPFELTVRVKGDPNQARAHLHTNANHNDDPSRYDDLEMKPVAVNGDQVTFRVDVPIHKIGNYRASARVTADGETKWLRDAGLQDIRFRPRAEAHDALNMREINIQNVNGGGRGTLEDLMAAGSPETNGKYTLESLKRDGINSLWVMPPFERSKWDHRHPMDDAGSPYAAKNYFQVEPEFSAEAMRLRAAGASEADVEKAANESWKQFVDKAHGLGMKVIVDVALNHVGHNFEFADLFGTEVRTNDFSQVVTNPAQLQVIEQRLSDPNVPDYAEYLLPELFASRHGDPDGAHSVQDIMAGGDQWFDTKQLNTGGSYGVASKERAEKTVQYLGRVMQHWATNMGVDGFRIDHLTGLPQTVLENELNKVQAAVDKARPGTAIYVTGEDFFNAEYNASHLDNIQDTWLRNALLQDLSPRTIKQLLLNDFFKRREMININSHDEHRFDFHGNLAAATRLNALLPLLGGTTMTVAGDEYAEAEQLQFKANRPVHALIDPAAPNRRMNEILARANHARNELPALRDDNTYVLRERMGGEDPDLLALARLSDDHGQNIVFTVANFSNTARRQNAFSLQDVGQGRIDPNRHYQLKNWIADNPNQPVWPQPKKGSDLLRDGLHIDLGAYHVQALELHAV